MRVKLLIVLAIASAVFMFLTGTASAGTTCGDCVNNGVAGLGFISPFGLTSGVANCLTAVPSSDVEGLYGVSDDLVSASGFVLPTFAGSDVGNAILGELVKDDFSTPDLVGEGYLPSFVPVESQADVLDCAIPSCVDYGSYPFLFEPSFLGAGCLGTVKDNGCVKEKACYDNVDSVACGC